MKSLGLILMLLTCICYNTYAQEITLKGKVVEETTKEPIPFATVAVLNKDTKQIITGTTTEDNGDFTLQVQHKDIIVEVSYLGYITETITAVNISNNEVNLGAITLKEDAQQLEEVVVQGELSQTEFKLDKRVFNVGKDLSNTGLGALEVLGNVPSVNVSIEGEISLRGSQGVDILINGKPSVLASEEGNALGTITSDMIERIEVITNPSAKYNAEGTSGIINIVLKKDEREGLNGSVTLNTGSPNNHSLGFSMNRRTEKFNLFTQLGAGRRTMPQEVEMESLDSSTNSEVRSKGETEKNESFINFTLGTDYLINDYNVITLSGNFAYEKEDENADALFSLLDNGEVYETYNREELTEATNPKYQYEFQYKRDYENHEDRTLLFSALGNFFGKDQSSDFNNLYEDESLTTRQRTRTNFKEAEYTFKLDYTHPFLERHTIETGAQYVLDDVSNDYAISDYEDGVYTENPNYSNVFDFNQNVLGVYGIWAYERDKWGVKGGLRLENTNVKTVLKNTDETNNRNYTNLFPSAHASYKMSNNISLQIGYSKRIYRPRLWDLNPFLNIQNTYSLRTGNPNLKPKYTDSYEITNIYKLGNLSLNAGVYYRYTDDVIERIVQYEGNVSTSMPSNVGTNKIIGAELNAKYIPVSWLTFTGDVNYNSFKRNGEFNDTSFDFNGDQWNSKLSSKVKLPADIDVEATFNYNSAYPTLQQQMSETWFMDMGVRKKIFKGKAIANLSVRDVFASRIFESYTTQDDFYQRNYNKRGRFITFGISFGFGKGEAMEFSGQKRH